MAAISEKFNFLKSLCDINLYNIKGLHSLISDIILPLYVKI